MATRYARNKPLSLRVRLALGYSIFFTLVLVFVTVGIYFVVRRVLIDQVRDELRVSAELINGAFDRSNTKPTSFFNDPRVLHSLFPQQIEGLHSPTLYVQVFGLDDQLIIASTNLRGQQLQIATADLNSARARVRQERVENLGSARLFALLLPLTDDNHVVGELYVAQSLQDVDKALTVLLTGMLVANIVALLAAIRGGTWLARGALGPVDAIVRTAQGIVHADDLHQRVPAVTTNDELGRLTRTINELLERLETLFTAQRRFIADVSHELRTPLTSMKGNLELLRAGMVEDPALRTESLADMEQEVNRMSRMANDLLLLAQAEAGVALRKEPLSLDDLLLEVYRALQPLAQHVALQIEITTQAEVYGDRDRLKQALLNLGANALQHTPAGGRVQLVLCADETWARVEVRDTGSGISDEALPHLFERFYRNDKARLRRNGGAGLGLAIVKWVADAHGGTVEVTSTVGQGSTFTLSVPLQTRSATSVYA